MFSSSRLLPSGDTSAGVKTEATRKNVSYVPLASDETVLQHHHHHLFSPIPLYMIQHLLHSSTLFVSLDAVHH
jgi:hypothetical protein